MTNYCKKGLLIQQRNVKEPFLVVVLSFGLEKKVDAYVTW